MSRPRIRTLKPEMWQSEQVGKLDHGARLLFIGLITMADDEGRLRAQPSMIAGHCFPYDRINAAGIDRALAQVESVGLIARYEAEDRPYVWIRGWAQHQKINRSNASKLPPPPGWEPPLPPVSITESSVNDPGEARAPITDCSRPRVGADRIGSDRKGELPSPDPSASGGEPVSIDLDWSEVMARLEQSVPTRTFALWLSELQPVGRDGAVVTVRAPDEKTRWIRDRMGELLTQTVRAVVGDPSLVVVVTETPAEERERAVVEEKNRRRDQRALRAAERAA